MSWFARRQRPLKPTSPHKVPALLPLPIEPPNTNPSMSGTPDPEKKHWRDAKPDPKILKAFKEQHARSNALQERYRARPNAGATNYVMLTPMAFMPPISEYFFNNEMM